jgi:hypothetical protein
MLLLGPPRRIRLFRRLLPPILFVFLPFLVQAPALIGWLNADPIHAFSMISEGSPGFTPGLPGYNDPNAGWHTEALGRLAAKQWLGGEIPWWNSFTGVGMPLAAEMQSSALFLPFILLLALGHGVVLLKIAMQVVAGLATYALLRHLKLRSVAALVGALLFEFNGSIAWTAHAPLLPVPFLPLFLLGIERARAASLVTNRLPTAFVSNGWRTISLAIAFSLYAGFPETAYLNGLLAILWAGYRLVTHSPGARLRFVSRIAVGGIVGLLLASPLLLSFAHYLFLSEVGGRLSVAMNDVGQDSPGFALYLFPYLLGPLAGFSGYKGGPGGTINWLWACAGGYLTLAIFFVALSALFAGSRERGLRWLLALWITVSLIETAAMPGIVKVFHIIPLMDYVFFARYAVPSWLMAAIILASFAIDDRLRKEYPRHRIQWAVVLFCVTAAIVAVFGAWPIITFLGQNAPYFHWYLIGSLLWAGVTFILVVLLLAQQMRMATILAAGLLVIDAISMFAFPLISGGRHPKLDLPAIKFLQDNLGFQRFYTLGPIIPNYGAYFELASINSNYQPTPAAWAGYIRDKLDSKSDVLMFLGNFPPALSEHIRELQEHLSAYRELGVKYIISPANVDPFTRNIQAPVETIGATPLTLKAGNSYQGDIPGNLISSGYIDAFGVEIGTYFGASTGILAIELCAIKVCAKGQTRLEGASDNKVLTIPLGQPLPVLAGDALYYTISHPEGGDVAIWLRPTSNPAPQLSPTTKYGSGFAPKWLLRHRESENRPPLVYADQLLSIYKLDNPAPYFETRGGPCRLTVIRRQEVTTECEESAVLIRREMSFPGWHAKLNGLEIPVGTLAPFFQTVLLPAGKSKVDFTYRPPGIVWTYGAVSLGLLSLLLASLPPAPRSRSSLVQNRIGIHIK